VILLSAYHGAYLGDPRYDPLMAELNRRHAYVFVHPAAIPDGAKPVLPLPDFLEEFAFDTTRAATMMMLTGVTQRYPDIRFQLAHATSRRASTSSSDPIDPSVRPPSRSPAPTTRPRD
jgi:6-methylsalicylate decarboxylase